MNEDDISKMSEEKLEETIDKVSEALPDKGDMSKTYEAQETIEAAQGGSFLDSFLSVAGVSKEHLRLMSIYKSADNELDEAEKEAEEYNKSVDEHNSNVTDEKEKLPKKDLKKVRKEAKKKAMKSAQRQAADARSKASMNFKSLEGSLSSQVNSIVSQGEEMFTKAPAQIGIVGANPYTAPSLIVVLLEISAAVTALLNVASTVISFAVVLNVPLPGKLNDMIIKLAGLKKMLNLGLSIPPTPVKNKELQDKIDKSCEEAEEKKEEGELEEFENNTIQKEIINTDEDDVVNNVIPPEPPIYEDINTGSDDKSTYSLYKTVTLYESNYFKFSEFTRSSKAEKYGINNTPNKDETYNIKKLRFVLLDYVREKYGKPIIITSGFRCEALNNKVKGAANSNHKYGCAVDLVAKVNTHEARIAENMILYNIIDKITPMDLINYAKARGYTKAAEELSIVQTLTPKVYDEFINEDNYSWIHLSFKSFSTNQGLKMKYVDGKRVW